MPTDNGWKEYRREVMTALNDNKVEIKALRHCVMEVKLEVTKLHERAKGTARFWGVLGGALSALSVMCIGIVVWIIRALANAA